MHLTVSGITIYPVKSLRGVAVSEAQVEPRGFQGDRRFMVVTADGMFLTQRNCRAMALLGARWETGSLILEGPDQEALSVVVTAGPTDEPLMDVQVWDSSVAARRVDPEADRWLSQALERPVCLVGMPESSVRPVSPSFDRGSDIVSFADGYPYLVIGDASLTALNQRLEEPVEMRRFRPNITVSGTEPFAEDDWRSFELGDVGFEGVKPCARCVMTTIDPDSAEAGREPLATLATFRTVSGQVMFGINAVPDGDGVVRCGDPVRVISRQ